MAKRFWPRKSWMRSMTVISDSNLPPATIVTSVLPGTPAPFGWSPEVRPRPPLAWRSAGRRQPTARTSGAQNDFYQSGFFGVEPVKPSDSFGQRRDCAEQRSRLNGAAGHHVQTRRVFTCRCARTVQRKFARDHHLQRQWDGRRHVANQCYRTSLANAADRQIYSGSNADGLKGDICSTSVRELKYLLQSLPIGAIHGVSRAQFRRQGQLVLGYVRRDNASAPCHAQSLDKGKADHPCANHHSRVVERQGCSSRGMESDGQWLDQSRLLEGQRFRNPIEKVLWDGHVFGKRAVLPVIFAGYSEHTAPIAEVDVASSAEVAAATVSRGIECYSVARLPVRSSGPNLGDDAGSFMSHDDRRPAPARTAIHAMNITAANPAGLD